MKLLIQKVEKLSNSNETMLKAQLNSLKLQEEMKEELSVLKKMIRKKNFPIGTDDYQSKLPDLPITSLEELALFEDTLEDPEEVKHLTANLAQIGGAKFNSVINNVMKILLSKDMAIRYSLHGKSNKEAFNKLKIYKCVIGKLLQI